MKLETIVQVRFSDEQIERLDQISSETQLTRSEVIRRLVDNATVKPAIVRTEIATEITPRTIAGGLLQKNR